MPVYSLPQPFSEASGLENKELFLGLCW